MIGQLLAIRVVMGVAGVALLVAARRVDRLGESPALRPFAALVAVVGALAIADAFAAGNVTMLSLVWLVAYLTLPTVFAWFVVEYYGLAYLATRARRVAFATPVALGVAGGTALVLSPSATGAMAGGGVGTGAQFPLVLGVAAALERFGLYYAAGVMIAGAALLVRTITRYEHLDRRLGVALAFVPTWPWVAYFASPTLAGRVGLGTIIGYTTVGYVLSIAAVAFALTRGDIARAAPATGTLGPETVLDELDEPVIVVDDRERVVRLNGAAVATFHADEAAAVGSQLAAVVGADLTTLTDEPTVSLDVAGRTRQFEATASAVTDRYGRSPGDAVVLRDVTSERVRAQRLAVLNRVVRHNLRNELSTIMGRAELITGSDADPADAAASILDSADDLAALGDRAHEVEDAMSRPVDPDPALAVEPVVAGVLDRFRTDNPEATLSVDVDESLTAAADGRLLSQVLENLVDNAIVHNDAPTPVVTVSGRADATQQEVQLTVADNGPGLPEHERAVIEAGEETPLEHGSGLGLWAVNWIVTRLGGDLSFAEREPTGTAVTVTLPAGASRDPTTPAVEAD